MPGREVPSKRVSFNCSDCDEPTTGVVGTKRVGATQCTACFGKGVDRRPKTLNDLTGKEWAQKSKSVDERIPPVIAPHEEDLGPGEEVLQHESKAIRQQPRP